MEKPENTQPELSIADLQNLKTLIDVAVRRGVFAANEMSSVGSVYDRLNTFLAAAQPAQQPEQSADTPE
jgi:hypothetical protein